MSNIKHQLEIGHKEKVAIEQNLVASTAEVCFDFSATEITFDTIDRTMDEVGCVESFVMSSENITFDSIERTFDENN